MSEVISDWNLVGAWRGGTVASVAISPCFEADGLALAATSAGIYRTTDHAHQWQRAGTGLTDLSVVAVAFAPAPDAPAPTVTSASPTAFASTETGRLFRSADGGQSWAEVSNWAGLGLITAIIPAPTYATDQTIFVATPTGMYRTLDAGQSWEAATFGLLDLDLLCLSCAPDFATSGVLWAGTALGGFFRSRNQGLAWRESGAGLPDTAIQAVLPAPDFATTSLLFVGTEQEGVYRSHDKGITWEPAGDLPAATSVNALAASQQGDRYTLLAGTTAGIYCSTDQGESWQLAAGGDLLALELATAGDTVLAATFQDGIACSTDGGQSWTATGSEIAAHAPPITLATSPSSLYSLDADGMLAISRDGGTSWAVATTPAAESRANSEEADAVSALAVDGQRHVIYATTDQLRWQAADTATESWQSHPLPTTAVTALAATTPATATMVALANQAGELFTAVDAGKSWQQRAVPWAGDVVIHLLFAPDAVAAVPPLYAVTARANAEGNYVVALWRSLDLGEAWQGEASLETELPSVLVYPPKGNPTAALLLATGHRIVRFFRDEANELAVQQHFFAQGEQVTALAAVANAASDQTHYAATTAGLYQSRDDGETWTRAAELPGGLPIVALLPAEDGDSPHPAPRAVTLGGEVWAHGTR